MKKVMSALSLIGLGAIFFFSAPITSEAVGCGSVPSENWGVCGEWEGETECFPVSVFPNCMGIYY